MSDFERKSIFPTLTIYEKINSLNVNYVINCKSCEYVTGICKLVSCQWGKPQQSILGREHSVPGIQNNRKYKLPHTFFYKTVNIKLKRQMDALTSSVDGWLMRSLFSQFSWLSYFKKEEIHIRIRVVPHSHPLVTRRHICTGQKENNLFLFQYWSYLAASKAAKVCISAFRLKKQILPFF